MKLALQTLAITLLIAACGSNSGKDSISKPFKFDRDKLDKLVKEKKAIYDISKRGDGTLQWEKYYLGDSVKYELNFDSKSNLSRVTKFDEHGLPVWQEVYYPNGQRKAHYTIQTTKESGMVQTNYDGYFEQYFENGNVMERGVYKNQVLVWVQKITKEGYPADTTFYDYGQ